MINHVNIQHETLNGAAFVIRRRLRFVPFSRRRNCLKKKKNNEKFDAVKHNCLRYRRRVFIPSF